jgi:hypothetical protein
MMAAGLLTLMWATAAVADDGGNDAAKEKRADAAALRSENGNAHGRDDDVGASGHGGEHSGTRGKSPSEPDQDGIGMDRGIFNDDKPPSGDGNNGCGNDPDREDDNNGWCGAQPEVSPTSVATESPTVQPETEVGAAGDEAEVLGKVVTRGEAPQVLGALAQTGFTLLGLVVAALALTASGAALLRRRS